MATHGAVNPIWSSQPPTPRSAPRVVRLACLVAFALLGLYLLSVGKLYIDKGEPDFEYFYKAGASLLAYGSFDAGLEVLPTGEDAPRDNVHWCWPGAGRPTGPVYARGKLDWYWPFVHRAATLLAWMPYRPAGYIWLGGNLMALFVTLRLVGGQLTGLPPRDWPVTLLLPFLSLLVYWHWEFHLNQIDLFTMLLLVASFVLWQRGRRSVAGIWLGLAVLIKVTPALLVGWFLLKRQYRTVAAALVTIVLAGPASDLVAFGPQKTLGLYQSWVHNAVTRGSHRGLIASQREMDWRNQGLGAVASRWLHPTNYNTHFDNEPRAPSNYEPRTMNVTSLSLETIALLVNGVMVATLVGLVWLTRRSAARLGPWQLRFEWALCLLAMLWFMPVMRRYHMIWAFPAVALLAAGVHHIGLRRGWSWLALGGVALVVLGQVALPTKVLIGANMLEARGMLLGSVVVLAAPIVALLMRLARDPGFVSAPLTVAAPAAVGSTRATVPDAAQA